MSGAIKLDQSTSRLEIYASLVCFRVQVYP
jgi:hypothetical protein